MAFWLTIEVQHGATPADAWRRAHGEALIEAAVTNGAVHWEWHTTQWGLILELEFRDEQARNAFRELPAAIAALDAVPDPVLGLLVYPAVAGALAPASHAGRAPRPSPAPLKPRSLVNSSSSWRPRCTRALLTAEATSQATKLQSIGAWNSKFAIRTSSSVTL
jgi:hypothetical protein